MIARRNLLIGGACLGAALAAEALRPRQHLDLLRNVQLRDIIPRAFGVWAQDEAGPLNPPESEDALATKLYSQQVARLYTGPNGAQIMLLIAYGPQQSAGLQLHRPEECYPAFGFSMHDQRRVDIPLPKCTPLPAAALTATSGPREEHILYWTRIGEAFPTAGGEQHAAIFQNAVHGVIGDGILVRCSNALPNAEAALALNLAFAQTLIQAIAPQHRAMFIGTQRTGTLR